MHLSVWCRDSTKIDDFLISGVTSHLLLRNEITSPLLCILQVSMGAGILPFLHRRGGQRMGKQYGIESLEGVGYDYCIANYLTVRPPTPSLVPYPANRLLVAHVS